MHTGKLDIHNNIVSRSIRRVPGVDLFTRLEFLDMNQTLFTEEDIFLSGILFQKINSPIYLVCIFLIISLNL